MREVKDAADLRRLLAELGERATPGPWSGDAPMRLKFNGQEGPLMSYLCGGRATPEEMRVSLGSERLVDHQLVAALRNNLPLILDALAQMNPARDDCVRVPRIPELALKTIAEFPITEPHRNLDAANMQRIAANALLLAAAEGSAK